MWVVRYTQYIDLSHFGVFLHFWHMHNFLMGVRGKYWLRYDIFYKAGCFVSNIVLEAFLITANGYFMHGSVLSHKKPHWVPQGYFLPFKGGADHSQGLVQ